MNTLKLGPNLSDKLFLDRYELLRRHRFLPSTVEPQSRQDLALFIHRGMLLWLKSWLLSIPPMVSAKTKFISPPRIDLPEELRNDVLWPLSSIVQSLIRGELFLSGQQTMSSYL